MKISFDVEWSSPHAWNSNYQVLRVLDQDIASVDYVDGDDVWEWNVKLPFFGETGWRDSAALARQAAEAALQLELADRREKK